MRKFLVLCLALLLPLAACGDDSPTDPTQSAVGTYTLVQVNGSPLPAYLGQSPQGRADVLSGTLTLRNDKSYTEMVNVQVTPLIGAVHTVPVNENGTFTITGRTVQFMPDTGGTYSGTLTGTTLESNAKGLTARYEKQ